MTFAENLMTYALGRRVEAYDMPTLRTIVARAPKRRTTACPAFVAGITRSAAFQMSRSGPGRETHRSPTPAASRSRRMIITKRHLSRRTVLKGIGVTAALPFLDAMAPAATALAKTAAKGKVRFVAIEMVHGAAGSCAYGLQNNLWSPAATGRSFDLSPDVAGAARAAARLRDHRQQHRRAHGGGVHDAGDRRRSFPRQLRVPHPGASQADDGIGPVCRDVVRPDLRARIRSGHGDSVDAAVHRDRSITPAAASTTTRAPTPTRSAGRRRASRCRCCATRARCSTRCSASAPRPRNARGGGARTAASSTRSSRRSIA